MPSKKMKAVICLRQGNGKELARDWWQGSGKGLAKEWQGTCKEMARDWQGTGRGLAGALAGEWQGSGWKGEWKLLQVALQEQKRQ